MQLALFRVATHPAQAPRYDIVTVNADGSELRALVGESLRQNVQPLLFDRPAWSPDGSSVAFTADLRRSRGRVGRPTDIYVISAKGTDLRRLSHTGRAFAPVWSPDGRIIAFSQRVASARVPFTSTLWVMDARGSNARQLTVVADGRRDVPGNWSADGRLLAFTRSQYDRDSGSSRSRIYVIRVDGSHARMLTNRGSDPAWSRDGRRLVFASDRDRNGRLSYGDRTFFANELYLQSDARRTARLTRTRALNEASPAWSPDGRWIAYQRGKVVANAEALAVLVMNPNGGCRQPIASDSNLRTWYARPVWRPRTRQRS